MTVDLFFLYLKSLTGTQETARADLGSSGMGIPCSSPALHSGTGAALLLFHTLPSGLGKVLSVLKGVSRLKLEVLD